VTGIGLWYSHCCSPTANPLKPTSSASRGRVWRPTHADMEQVWEYELTIRLISQLEAAAANHDAAE
jgi:hypothetical protein